MIDLTSGAECSGDLVGPLGVESRFIRNAQFSASSEFSGYRPENGRLNNGGKYGYWSTADQYPSVQQWIQVDFLDSTTTGNDVIITGIQTQGSSDRDEPCWVKELRVLTGNTADHLEFIFEEETNIPKVGAIQFKTIFFKIRLITSPKNLILIWWGSLVKKSQECWKGTCSLNFYLKACLRELI